MCTFVDALERRQLLSASSPHVINLDDVRVDYPTISGDKQLVVVMDTGFSDTYKNASGVVVDNAQFVATVGGQRVSKLWKNPKEIAGNGSDDDGDGYVDNVNGWNFVANNKDVHDDNGHGTRVAGVIAASKFNWNGVDYQGIAPDVQIIPLKVAAQNGTFASWQRINEAFKWVYEAVTVRKLPIVAINMSWGFYGTGSRAAYGIPDAAEYTITDGSHPTSIQKYVQDLRGLGVFAAQAAGNSGNGLGQRPGVDNDVMVVGSLNLAGTARWVNPDQSDPNYRGSNFGPDSSFVDIYAPGYWPLINHDPYNVNNPDYGELIVENDGATSFATPLVTGAAALLKSVNPTMAAGDVVGGIFQILRQGTATSVNDPRGTDGQGNPIYWTDPILDLKAAVRQTFQGLTSADVGEKGTFTDIEFDSTGNLHMAWYSDTAHMLFYSKRTGTSWSAPEAVDYGRAIAGSAASSDVGNFLSLALDPSGSPMIAHYDPSNADLRVARRNATSGAWELRALDTNNTVGYYPCLKFNGSRAGISYYEKTFGNLKFIEFDGTTWSAPQVAASQGNDDVGRYSTTAIDPSTGLWAVAFDDSSGTRGLYVRQVPDSTGKTWTAPSVIDILESDVAYTDLKFDDLNRPAVSYYDTKNADLKLAYAANASGSSWTAGIVAGRGTKGLYTNLRFMSRDTATNAPIWEIVYDDKTVAPSVWWSRGPTATKDQYNVWQGFGDPQPLAGDGGSNVAALWRGNAITIAYTKNDLSFLSVLEVVPDRTA